MSFQWQSSKFLVSRRMCVTTDLKCGGNFSIPKCRIPSAGLGGVRIPLSEEISWNT